MIENHARIEIVGLHHTTYGRECIHEAVCGIILKLDSICRFSKVELEFEYEEIRCSRREVLSEYTKAELIYQCQQLGFQTLTKLKKTELIRRILDYEA